MFKQSNSQKTRTQNGSMITSDCIRVYKDKSLIDNTYLHFRSGQNFDHEHLLCYYDDHNHYEAYWLEKISPNEFYVRKTYERMCRPSFDDPNKLYVDGKANIYDIHYRDDHCEIIYGEDDQPLFRIRLFLTCKLQNYLGTSKIHHIRDQFYLLTILPPKETDSAIILCNGKTAIFFLPQNSLVSAYNDHIAHLNEIVLDPDCFKDVMEDEIINRLVLGETLNEMKEILETLIAL